MFVVLTTRSVVLFVVCPSEDVKKAEKNSILVGYRNVGLQHQRCLSVKERATSSEAHRDHEKLYRQAKRSRHALD